MINQLHKLVQGCKANNRMSQESLYKDFYGYAMSICLQYTKSKDEAEEVAQDGFIKIFSKINQYDNAQPFKSWIRRIFINSAIDHFRRNKKFQNTTSIEEMTHESGFDDNIIDNLSAQDILKLIKKLPHAYQLSFVMYVVEGYKHSEISEALGISIGTSKSNLSKARSKLKGIIKKYGY